MAVQTNQNRLTSLALQTLGWAGVIILGLILLGIVGGPTFRPIIQYIGLDLPGYRGIFVDCTLYENRHHDFCKKGGRRVTHGEDPGSLNTIEKGSLPFSLHN